MFILQIIGIFGYLCECLFIYNSLLNNYIHEIKSFIHNTSKVLFYASIGMTVSFLININNLRFHRKKTLFFCLFVLYIIRDFSLIEKNFYYLKSIFNGIAATCYFIFFLLIPLEMIENYKFNLIIIQITNFTGGIYYLHTKVWDVLSQKLIIMKNKNISGCILNYLICYFICYFGTKVFGKTKLKYLFN